MKKFFGYTVLIVCTAIYFISWDQKLNDKIYARRLRANSIISSDKFRYGDLYGMSYLSYFRKAYHKDGDIPLTNCKCPSHIDLYVVCDSYIWPIFNSIRYYCGVEKLTNIKTNDKEKLYTKLNALKTNVLMLEFSERNLRYILEDTAYSNNIFKPDGAHTMPEQKNVSFLGSAQRLKTTVFNFVFNKKINTNLEANIWDISLFRYIKEFKADINYKLFDAVDPNVKITKNGKQLFYTPTIDTNDIMSSFKYVNEKEKDRLISKLNGISAEAKKIGFNKVYLTIVPNPVSILAPRFNNLKYNNLAARIQNSTNLQISFINLLPAFKRQKNKIYFAQDSHWNLYGANIWLSMFNNELYKTICADR